MKIKLDQMTQKDKDDRLQRFLSIRTSSSENIVLRLI